MNPTQAFQDIIGRAASNIWPFTFIRRILYNGTAMPYRPDVNFTGPGVTVTDTSGKTTVNVPVGPTAYQTIQDEGTPLTQRSTMNFIGTSVVAADNGGSTRTDITVTAYNRVQDEGTPLTQRDTMNFVGAGVTATDSGGITVVTIPTSITQGTALLDFGAFPGKSDATLAVASATIGASSVPEAWIFPSATADHTADEHDVETLKVFARDVSAGVGFTLYGVNSSQLDDSAGLGTRIYGKWNVGWRWQ